MITELSRKRCFNHAHRETVARCPECREYFCRECVVEHDTRILCATCVSVLAEKEDKRNKRRGGFRSLAGAMVGVLVASSFFFLIGWGLLSLPSPTHDKTFWKKSTADE